jgi:uncharacterized membrane protein YqgA involved in biofilm formation
LGGTILNAITVAIGTALGLLIGHRLTARIQESVVTGLGLVTLFVGISNAGQTGNVIIPLISIVTGVIIGELLDIDGKLQAFAGWLQAKFARSNVSDSDIETFGIEEGKAVHETSLQTPSALMDARQRFITGYVTASLVFCVGPLTFVGSMMDGMGLPLGFEQLAIKSTLDAFAAMAFAASFGVGVGFSIVTVLVLQGGLALLGALVVSSASDPLLLGQAPVIREMTSVGGLLLIGLSLTLLDVKKPRIANFLPALLIAPLIVWIASLLCVNIYPL